MFEFESMMPSIAIQFQKLENESSIQSSPRKRKQWKEEEVDSWYESAKAYHLENI